MSHSKRNTSLAFFTSHERSLLKNTWGSQSTRLSRDSFLPFGSCQLCLNDATDAVACPHGDVFCRECAVSNLLAQRKEIKRLEKEAERRQEEGLESQRREEEEVRQRSVREFERVQMGLEGGKGSARGGGGAREERPSNGDAAITDAARGTKRKFELDEEELLRIAREERSRMKRALSEERKSSKPALPSFWAPSQTPSLDTTSTTSGTLTPATAKSARLHPVCPASAPASPHPLSLKTLTTINFTIDDRDGQQKRARTCPACRKALSNASKAVLAVPCGHVLCKPCVGKFMTPPSKSDPHAPDAGGEELRCYVCEAGLCEGGREGEQKSGRGDRDKKDKDKSKPGLVELRSEGTGFAGGGKNLVRREGVAFQC